jgi:hypothetical protein
MRNPIDITLKLGDFESYRLTTHTDAGASFVAAHLPGHKEAQTLPADQAKAVMDRAEACALVVVVE